jgi:uncharacterized protein DUF1236
LISAAALLAGMAMASAQTMPQGGTGQPGPGAAPERSAPQPSPRGGQAQQGQDKGKAQGAQGQAQDKGKAQPGAQGQAQEKGKAQPGAQGQAQEKGKAQPGAQGQDRTPAARGQREGQRERDQTTGQGAQGQRDQAQPQRGQRDQSQQGQRGQDSQPPRATEGQAGQGGSATLTAEQRTRVRETVITRGPRVTSVDFSVSVGTVVPRTVTVIAVPAVLVEIYPQYRGRKYFVYNDEIIIVDDEYRIVAVIQV